MKIFITFRKEINLGLGYYYNCCNICYYVIGGYSPTCTAIGYKLPILSLIIKFEQIIYSLVYLAPMPSSM